MEKELEMMGLLVGLSFHSARNEVGAARSVAALVEAAGPTLRLKESDPAASRFYAEALRGEALRLEGEADALPFPARRVAVKLLRLHGEQYAKLAA